MPGTHNIGYRDKKGTAPRSPVEIPVKVKLPGMALVHEKRILADKWSLRVGDTLAQMLSHASKHSFDLAPRLAISDVHVKDLQVGKVVWSKHRVAVGFDYELTTPDGKLLKTGSVSGQGEASGRELSLLTFLGLGKMYYDRAMEVALTRSLGNCLGSLASEIDLFVKSV